MTTIVHHVPSGIPIDDFDPQGKARRARDHEKLARMQNARQDAGYGTTLHYALGVAIDVFLGAKITLADDLNRLHDHLDPSID